MLGLCYRDFAQNIYFYVTLLFSLFLLLFQVFQQCVSEGEQL